MVNRWLRRGGCMFLIETCNAPPVIRRIPKAALTQPLGGPRTGQEVVLDRAIHGLLRAGDGKTCRGTLRDRSFWGIARRWSAHPTIGTREAPFAGDRYER